jgi:hypothetical protein
MTTTAIFAHAPQRRVDYSPAGADYWFVLPEYQPVDRLAEEECPLDEITDAAEQEEIDRYLAAIHSLRCPHVGMGDHLAEECPR